jgi:membrane protein DedA with SNARE-associated domain
MSSTATAGRWFSFGRFVSILRTYTAFLAGTNRMQWRSFLVFNAADGIVWAVIYTIAGYAVGNTIRNVSGTVNVGLGVAAAVVVIVAIVVVRQQAGRLAAVAEAAYPGPLED